MNPQVIDQCFKEAIKRHPFWFDKKSRLKYLLDVLKQEIEELEEAAKIPLNISGDLAKKTKLVWCFSGSGSYDKPLLDISSDERLKKLSWAYGTDKKRLDLSAKIIRELKSKGASVILVYNGVKEQNEVLVRVAEDKLGLLKNDLYISEGKIVRTIDQVSGLRLPPSLKLKRDDLVGIVSHAAHLSRIMRMVEKFKPFPEGVEIIVFPLVFEDAACEDEFSFREIMGILGYISRQEISVKPYPYMTLKSIYDEIKITKITDSDLLNTFNLSNQDDVRAVSFSVNKIKLEDHKKWFAKKIKDKNVVMLKALFNGQFAGQIRLDIEGKKAVLSISVDKNFRGKNIASKLIRKVILKAKKKNVKIIEAEIKSDNLPSIRLFEKNGFAFDGSFLEAGQQIKKYSYKL